MAGVQQVPTYYYIDNVSVVPVEAKSQCSCSSRQRHRTSCMEDRRCRATWTTRGGGPPAVYYAFVKRLHGGRQGRSRRLAHPQGASVVVLEIMGHCDNDEVSEGKISPRFADMGRKRAEQVKRYLVSQGVSDGQLSVMGVENADPASTKEPISRVPRTAAARSASSKRTRFGV